MDGNSSSERGVIKNYFLCVYACVLNHTFSCLPVCLFVCLSPFFHQFFISSSLFFSSWCANKIDVQEGESTINLQRASEQTLGGG